MSQPTPTPASSNFASRLRDSKLKLASWRSAQELRTIDNGDKKWAFYPNEVDGILDEWEVALGNAGAIANLMDASQAMADAVGSPRTGHDAPMSLEGFLAIMRRHQSAVDAALLALEGESEAMERLKLKLPKQQQVRIEHTARISKQRRLAGESPRRSYGTAKPQPPEIPNADTDSASGGEAVNEEPYEPRFHPEDAPWLPKRRSKRPGKLSSRLRELSKANDPEGWVRIAPDEAGAVASLLDLTTALLDRISEQRDNGVPPEILLAAINANSALSALEEE